MGIDIPPRRSEGYQLSASEDWNKVIEALRGLSQQVGPASLLMTLLGRQSTHVVLGKITAAPPAGVAILPSNCRYSAHGLGRNWTVVDALPTYGRRVKFDECAVYPAEVGDFCAIYRNVRVNGQPPVVELDVFTEMEARGPC